jgi:hypothetical protein
MQKIIVDQQGIVNTFLQRLRKQTNSACDIRRPADLKLAKQQLPSVFRYVFSAAGMSDFHPSDCAPAGRAK